MEVYLEKFAKASLKYDLVEKCEYSSSNIFITLYSYWFYKKYNTKLTNLFYFYVSSDFFKNEDFISNLAKYLINKENDIICLPLGHNLVNQVGHITLFIYRKKLNVIEHYDPNGETSYLNFYIKDKVDYLISILRDYLPSFNYKPSYILHRYKKFDKTFRYMGLQTYASGSRSESGYCQIWSYFINNLIFKFPEMSTRDILDTLEGEEIKINKIRKRLKEIIRGFYYLSLKEIFKFLELEFNFESLFIVKSEEDIHNYIVSYFDLHRS